MKKRILSMLLAIVMVTGLVPGFGLTASAATSTGTTGECTWTFDDTTGTLTVSGTGAMANYTSGSQPWYAYKDSITTVIVEKGVTSISAYAFSQFPALKTVKIAGSVTAIGNNAFYSCSNLTTVEYYGSSAPQASSNVFFGVYAVVKVLTTYEGNVFCGKMARATLDAANEPVPSTPAVPQITDVVISGDDVAVDSVNKTYTVPAGKKITVTVSGTNFDKITDEDYANRLYRVKYRAPSVAACSRADYAAESGTFVFRTTLREIDVGEIDLQYSTDGGQTYTKTGWKIRITASSSYTVTASASPAEGGTVTGGGTYAYGSVITLTAAPNDGYRFVKWMTPSAADRLTAEITVTVTENITYIAVFEPIPDPEVLWGTSKDSLTASGSWDDFAAAYTADSTAVTYAKLNKNIETDRQLTVVSALTLDLAGYNLTSSQGVLCCKGGNLTITDSAQIEGTVQSGGYCVASESAGTLLIEGGRFVAAGSDFSAVQIHSDSGSVVIAGGEFQADKHKYTINNEGTLTIRKGAVHSGNVCAVNNEGTLTISGILLEGTECVVKSSGSLTVKGAGILFTEGSCHIESSSGSVDLSAYERAAGTKVQYYGDGGAISSRFTLPDGYTLLDSTGAAITELVSGKIYTVARDTVPVDITVSVVDDADGTALQGVSVEIRYNKSGTVAASFVSDGSVQKISGLVAEENYTVHVTSVPAGYAIPSVKMFSVDKQGNISSTGPVSADGALLVAIAAQPVILVDSKGREIPLDDTGVLELGETYTLVAGNGQLKNIIWTPADLTKMTAFIINLSEEPSLLFDAAAYRKGADAMAEKGLAFDGLYLQYVANNLVDDAILRFNVDLYNVNVTGSEHGTVTADITKALAGETVTLTADGAPGFALGSVAVTDASGASVPVTDNTFVMPASDVTVTALWKTASYTITFDTDGGSAIAPITQEYGTAITAPADPVKEGCTFVGWDKEIPAAMPASDMTVTALWRPNPYTITFDTDGGTAIAPITQEYGTAITAPADPVKAGYTFAGWEPQLPAAMPAENLTVTALWTANTYTITFDTDGGTAVAPITQAYGTAITAPADPVKEGYTFVGWEPQLPAAMPAENTVVKAIYLEHIKYIDENGVEQICKSYTPVVSGMTEWPAGWYAVRDDVSIGSTVTMSGDVRLILCDNAVLSIIGDSGRAAVKAANLTVYGQSGGIGELYAVGGYSTGGSGDGIYVESGSLTVVGGCVTAEGGSGGSNSGGGDGVFANGSTVTVLGGTLNANGRTGAYGGNGVYIHDSTLTVSGGTLNASGASGDGWGNGEGISALNSSITVNGGTLNADGTDYGIDNEFNTSFEISAGSVKAEGGKSAIRKAPIIKGIFSVTVKDADGNTVGYDPAETVSHTYFAAVPGAAYKVSIDATAGGTVTAVPEEQGAGWKATVTAAADKGYTLTELRIGDKDITDALTDGKYSFILGDSDVTVTAKFEPNRHDIVYTVDGVEHERVKDVAYGTAITPIPAPVREGYTFSGWSTVPATMPDEDVTVTGTFAVNSYTLTFNTDGGTAIAPITQNYGTKITAPADPTKEGHTFAGWDKQIPAEMPAENLTVTALWKVNAYTFTFNTNGGTAIAPITQNYGTKITAPATTLAGYGFGGWFEDTACTVAYVFTADSTVPARDVTLYAKWNPLDGTKYTVNHLFENLDGTFTAEPEEMAGRTESDTKAAAKDADGFTAGSVTQKPIRGDGSTVIEIRYTRNTYTLTVNRANGQANIVTALKFGAPITLPSAPRYTGYTFAGWSSVPAAMPASDLTVTALWTANVYQVTLIPNGGTVTEGNITSYTYGIGASLPTAVTRSGYFFRGWYDNAELTGKPVTGIAADARGAKTYYAKWEQDITPFLPLLIEYKIHVSPAEGGTVTADRSSAPYGKTVQITASPADGYKLTGIVAADSAGRAVAVTKTGANTFTFKMPMNSVTVLGLFEKTETPASGASACRKDSTCPMSRYPDLKPTEWYHDGIHFCLASGLMNGFEDGTFQPDTATSRAMIVTMLWRMNGSPVVNYLMTFEDVDEEAWYAEAVRWAASQKIVEGYGDGRFDPDAPVTREQLAAILYRFEQKQGGGFKGMWMFRMDYADLESLSDWAYEPMCFMTMKGIVNGKPGKILDPQGSATRAEAAAMLCRYVKLRETEK